MSTPLPARPAPSTSAVTSPSTASASARCASPATGSGVNPATATRPRSCCAAPIELRRQLHRHRGLLRSRRQRGAHRRGAAPVSRRSRDRDQGRPRAHRPEPVAVERAPRPPQGGVRRQPAAARGSTRSRCTSCTDPTRTCPTRTRSARWSSSRTQGKIRHIGVSNVDEAQLRVAQSVTPVVSVQNRYNVSDRELGVDARPRASRNSSRSCPSRRSRTSRTTRRCSDRGRARRATPRRSCSRGCWRARRRCCRSPAPDRSPTWRRTSTPRRLDLPRARWQRSPSKRAESNAPAPFPGLLRGLRFRLRACPRRSHTPTTIISQPTNGWAARTKGEAEQCPKANRSPRRRRLARPRDHGSTDCHDPQTT